MTDTRKKTAKLVQAAFFVALILVLQFVATLIKFGPQQVSVSFAFIPIIIGGMLMGPAMGAFFGGVFGFIVMLMCVNGMDAGGAMLLAANPVLTVILCFVKGIAAGWISALVYKAMSKNKPDGAVALITSSALSPIVNTSLFLIITVLFYRPTLQLWAGGSDLFTYLFTGTIILNFIFELTTSVILCPIIAKILFKSKLFARQ